VAIWADIAAFTAILGIGLQIDAKAVIATFLGIGAAVDAAQSLSAWTIAAFTSDTDTAGTYSIACTTVIGVGLQIDAISSALC
jgi:hypothetical protein